MHISHLHLIDWLIIAVYFITVIFIGFHTASRAQTTTDYFLAGRRNSTWISGIAFLSANMGTLELLGMSGQAYQHGILTAHFYLIGAIPAMLFLGIFMLPMYYSQKIHSVPAYLYLRFGEATRSLNALAFAVMTLLMSGINMYAMALVLHIFVGWSLYSSIYISSVTIAIYIGLGGLTSAIFSEVLQFFLIWFGLILAVILGIVHVGGWHEVIARVPDSYLHLWSTTGSSADNPLFINWIGLVMGLGFVLGFGYWTTDFLVVQRAMSAKNLKSSQMTPILASFFKMALPIIVIVPGLLAVALLQKHVIAVPQRPDDALLLILNRYYPPGLLGLGVTALLAGFMAGQAGNVSAFNTVFTFDIYRAHVNKHASDQHYVKVGRVVTIIGIILSIVTAYWAMSMPSIMDYMQALFSIVNAPLLATILLGMFFKRTNGFGAFWGLLCGMVISTILFLGLKFNFIPVQYMAFTPLASSMAANFWRAVWAWLITFIVTIILSTLTKRPAIGSMKELVHSLTVLPNYSHEAWFKRPGFWAGISLLIFIVLNIIFW
jgi:SSS family solute:Na+ symporter